MDACQFEQIEAQVVNYFKLAGDTSIAYMLKEGKPWKTLGRGNVNTRIMIANDLKDKL